MSITSEREQPGDWDLPGGEVRDDDFCISTAIERLVREQTALRVTKVLEMLGALRWTTEMKVLLWDEEDDETEIGEDDSYGHEYGYGYGNGTGNMAKDGANRDQGRPKVKAINDVGIDWSMTLLVARRGTYNGNNSSISDDPFAHFRECGINNTSGGCIPTNSPSLFSSPTPSTPDSAPVLPLPPLPKHYNYGHDHHQSLEPAPLSLPPLSVSGLKPIPLGTTVTYCRRRVPEPALPFFQPARTTTPQAARFRSQDRRHAQIIPYKIVRKRYVQLNFTVLVDEEPDEEPLPPFFANNSANTDMISVCEHEDLVWATFDRVKRLPMSEDLRGVVYQGLAWVGKLAGGFI
jgi:hypothetical protein